RLRNQLETLNLAQISTIHQFCRVILNYAGPFHVDGVGSYAPSYEISSRALREAIDVIVSRWMDSDIPQKEELLNVWPVHKIRKLILDAYLDLRNKGLSINAALEETKRSMLLK